MLWEGYLPISNRVWWPARAAKFGQFNLPPSRSAIVVEMIKVRRRKDSRLRQLKPPNQWPMFRLWETPEATLLSTVEDFDWLKDAGLGDLAALRRLAVHNRDSEWPLGAVSTFREFVAQELSMVDPIYVGLGDEVLTKALEIAEQWSHGEIKRTKSDPPFPPMEWLEKRINIEDIESGKMASTVPSGKRLEFGVARSRIT
jgi:hypothetical protein